MVTVVIMCNYPCRPRAAAAAAAAGGDENVITPPLPINIDLVVRF